MEDYPRSLVKFEERFGTEAACLEYLAMHRLPNGFSCPECQSRHGSLGVTRSDKMFLVDSRNDILPDEQGATRIGIDLTPLLVTLKQAI